MLTIAQVRNLLATACYECGGQARWAQLHGVSPAYVSDVLTGRSHPGDAILRPLKLERVVTYQWKDKACSS